ncbi:MAG TPA: DNA primase noncatalytic subunit PriX, partial [Nitrososphaeraceae archaeon]|nr:DNA primase noncatalytic subunit PriX [Nitrososphaeraceae archaeon]
LNTPVSDFRKNATNLILTPYLVNIKKLSYQQSFDILIDWLHKCNSLRKLDFKPEHLVKNALTTAIQKGIPPMKSVTLKDRNLELYNILYKV